MKTISRSYRNPTAFAHGFNAARLVRSVLGRHDLPRAKDAYDMGYALGLLGHYADAQQAYKQFLCDPAAFVEHSAYTLTPCRETA